MVDCLELILNDSIDFEMRSVRDSEMMKECLELRLSLIKTNYSLKTEYEKNEVDILKMKTEMQIERLQRVIIEKTKNFQDVMKIYFHELEENENVKDESND